MDNYTDRPLAEYFSLCHLYKIVCVCETCHQSVWCVQIMRWFVFQYWTVSAPELCSVTMFNTLFYPRPPQLSHKFLDISWLTHPSYRPPSVSVRHRSAYISHPLPTSSPCAERHPPGIPPKPPTSSFRLLSLCPTPRACACCHYRVRSPPPVASLDLQPGPCQPLGVSPSRVPPRLCDNSSPYMCAAPLLTKYYGGKSINRFGLPLG